MPHANLVCKAEFCAAFRLHNAEKDSAWNLETYGICNSENFHGHNWQLEVEVSGEVQADTGMVMDLLKLQAIIEEKVISRVDHRNLNLDVEFLSGKLTTTENLAIAFWAQIQPALPNGVDLVEIRLKESKAHSIRYSGK
ncbi:MAG: 6-carboxytetrahydropterin synthase [Planctomycetota bacterium]|jgi:6-pyruvoyltetrahydropterin/6-carboxytetrahydropterin synthase|nr:6-carboxytetrahydropterin synthase [Planctomycetota bacterium]MDP6941040.1 6-carboxytetrahydropterin synthase [Planctomycetota bacterium]